MGSGFDPSTISRSLWSFNVARVAAKRGAAYLMIMWTFNALVFVHRVRRDAICMSTAFRLLKLTCVVAGVLYGGLA